MLACINLYLFLLLSSASIIAWFVSGLIIWILITLVLHDVIRSFQTYPPFLVEAIKIIYNPLAVL